MDPSLQSGEPKRDPRISVALTMEKNSQPSKYHWKVAELTSGKKDKRRRKRGRGRRGKTRTVMEDKGKVMEGEKLEIIVMDECVMVEDCDNVNRLDRRVSDVAKDCSLCLLDENEDKDELKNQEGDSQFLKDKCATQQQIEDDDICLHGQDDLNSNEEEEDKSIVRSSENKQGCDLSKKSDVDGLSPLNNSESKFALSDISILKDSCCDLSNSGIDAISSLNISDNVFSLNDGNILEDSCKLRTCVPSKGKKTIKWKNSGKVAPKTDRANRSWLDNLDDGDEEALLSSIQQNVNLNPPTERKIIEPVSNQLDGYQNRYRTFFKSNNSKSDELSSTIDDYVTKEKDIVSSSVLNNEKNIAKIDGVGSKIGVNVNDLKSKKKADSTKRSRRKTEPFDFSVQADGDLDVELLRNSIGSFEGFQAMGACSNDDSFFDGFQKPDGFPGDSKVIEKQVFKNNDIKKVKDASSNKEKQDDNKCGTDSANCNNNEIGDRIRNELNVNVAYQEIIKQQKISNSNVLNGNQSIEVSEAFNNPSEKVTETPNKQIPNGLFSGSISDSGLFIPTSSAYLDKPGSRRDSLDMIFDDDYDFEGDTDEDLSVEEDCRSDADDNGEDSTREDGFERMGNDCDIGLLGVLPPEPQLGNVEYKLKLVKPTKQRFEHLVTQMKWRLREGRGEALYEIGVRDCGLVRGLARRELRASLRTLRRMAASLGAAASLLATTTAPGSARVSAEVLVRKVPDDQHNIEVRVAVMGSNDAGKSTLVGVLTQGTLDNGRGSARLNMFRHLHEVRTGRTSSVSHEILGFDPQGRPINYAYSELMTSEEISERSSKLVAFIDLAGHRKYLKTTVQGLTGYSPHYAMLVVSASAGLNQMTLEHLALVVALDLPFFVVVTKTDATPAEATLKQLKQSLAAVGCRKVTLPVLSPDDVVVAASNALSRLAVPVFPVSCVTGHGLDSLRWFLFLAPPAMTSSQRDRLEQEPVEFQVDETFKVGDASGPVVGGLLKKGILTERTQLLIGPLESGDFVPVCVNSLHRNKAPCRVVRAGQAAALGLAGGAPRLRQGMVLLAMPVASNTTKPSKQSRPARTIEHIWNFGNVSPKATKKMRKKMDSLDGNKTCNEDNRSRSRKMKRDTNANEHPEFATKNNAGRFEDGNLLKSNRTVGGDGILDEASCEEKLEQIVNDIKKETKSEFEENLKKLQKDQSDKLVRLSPSRYTSRFTSTSHSISRDLMKESTGNTEMEESSTSEEENDRAEYDSMQEDTGEVLKGDKKRDNQEYQDEILEEDPNDPRGCYFFQANVSLLNHSTAVYPGFQSTVHIGNIRQTAVIEGILSSNSVLRANDCAPVLFRFMRHPEYVVTGDRVLFREALHTKGVGRVTQVFPHRQKQLTS